MMRDATILLLEGATAAGHSLEPALERAGYQVHVEHSCRAALEWASEGEPGLVVFDAATLSNGEQEGCHKIQQALDHVPIIHVRAKGTPRDPEARADIYLAYPFTARKLLNRVRRYLSADGHDRALTVGDVHLSLTRRVVEVAGRTHHALTPRQAKLLEAFLRNPDRIVSRKELMKTVWDTDYVGDTRTLDVHIRWVREAIEEYPSKPKRLVTVRGKGYIFHSTPK